MRGGPFGQRTADFGMDQPDFLPLSTQRLVVLGCPSTKVMCDDW
jgi:hypothetical protein